MEKQDAQIYRDGKSLGNLLITGEFHVGTASKSLHTNDDMKKAHYEGNLQFLRTNLIMDLNIACLYSWLDLYDSLR